MSSASGITATPQLVESFANAVAEDNIRVLKVSIENEALVETSSWPKSGDLARDFEYITDYVEDSIPAYLLVRLDTNTSDWLCISYVPDSAKVRDKMLYASTQSSLRKSLGDSKFKDTIFATSKADLSWDSYLAHLSHMAAPKPLSAREAEMANIRAAERAAGTSTYQGAGVRKSHVGNAGVGFEIPDDIQEALKELSEAGETTKLVILGIDVTTERLVKKKTESGISPNHLGTSIPSSEPSYAFYSWSRQLNGESVQTIIYVYSCPSSSPVKSRMLYSAGVQPLAHMVKQLGVKIDKKSETSDPEDINEAWLLQEVGHVDSGTSTPASTERVAFAKPRGPPRRR